MCKVRLMGVFCLFFYYLLLYWLYDYELICFPTKDKQNDVWTVFDIIGSLKSYVMSKQCKRNPDRLHYLACDLLLCWGDKNFHCPVSCKETKAETKKPTTQQFMILCFCFGFFLTSWKTPSQFVQNQPFCRRKTTPCPSCWARSTLGSRAALKWRKTAVTAKRIPARDFLVSRRPTLRSLPKTPSRCLLRRKTPVVRAWPEEGLPAKVLCHPGHLKAEGWSSGN